MNTPLYIARKMGGGKKKLSGLVKAIAILSIALGLSVMILAVSIVTGFQQEIRDKVIGFGAHIQISNFDYNLSYETQAVSIHQDFYPDIAQTQGIKHIQVFATKPGIIKTDSELHGVVVKGIGADFDWSFFDQRMVEGKILNLKDSTRNNEIIISRYISRLLQLKSGDDAIVYFIQDPPRVRRFTIAGVYETGMEELDKVFILADIRHIQRLNNWGEDQVGGFEILVDNFRHLNAINEYVYENIDYTLNSRTIREIYPQIFDWLALLDMNVYVIIAIMVLVAGINMISTLLISVLEKTNLVGILKALGGNNQFVRRVFLYNASFLILRGLLAGNILGLGLALTQKHFSIMKLSQESYFIDVVPINIELGFILALNLGTFLICFAMLILPSWIVSHISPVKAITFR